MFRADPGGYEKLFNTPFLAQVPASQLTSIFSKYFADAGRCTGARLVGREGPNSGRFKFTFASGVAAAATLAIEASAPYLIAGLFLGPLTPGAGSLEDIIRDSKGLPGEKSFLFAKLAGAKIVPVAE
ncbi:MAG: hypothetical protein H0X34_10875 [Chthoniobacterales bacterium]|nr:hypothetical protein [Chthoniobacterales bacterium]